MSDAPGPWLLLVCPECEATCYGPQGTLCKSGHEPVGMKPVCDLNGTLAATD